LTDAVTASERIDSWREMPGFPERGRHDHDQRA
jgi:hypothetical protein